MGQVVYPWPLTPQEQPATSTDTPPHINLAGNVNPDTRDVHGNKLN